MSKSRQTEEKKRDTSTLGTSSSIASTFFTSSTISSSLSSSSSSSGTPHKMMSEIPFASLPKEIKKYIADYKNYSKEEKINDKDYWNNLSLEDQNNLIIEYRTEIAKFYTDFLPDLESLITGYVSDDQAACIDTQKFSADKPDQYYCALFQNRLTPLALADHVIKE